MRLSFVVFGIFCEIIRREFEIFVFKFQNIHILTEAVGRSMGHNDIHDLKSISILQNSIEPYYIINFPTPLYIQVSIEKKTKRSINFLVPIVFLLITYFMNNCGNNFKFYASFCYLIINTSFLSEYFILDC